MAAPEDTTQVPRVKRSVGIASAAGRRERRTPASKVRPRSQQKEKKTSPVPRARNPASRRPRPRVPVTATRAALTSIAPNRLPQDLDTETVKPTRRNAAPVAPPDSSSDRSADTGMNKTESAGATDPAVEPAKPRGAKFATRQATVPKAALAAAAKAANSGSDGDSAAAKAPKPAANAVSAKKTAQAPAKTEDVPRQRPTNNQLLCVSRRTASRERAPGRAGARNLRVFDVARGAAGARRRGRDRARARAPSPRRDFFFPSRSRHH